MCLSPSSQSSTGSTLVEPLAKFAQGSRIWHAGQRTVEWSETDASGFIHNSAILRYAEATEAALLRTLDLPGLFGTMPRVQQLVNFYAPLKFEDLLTIAVRVSELGRTSMTVEFAVWRHDDPEAASLLAADGRVVNVHVDASTRLPTVWPPDLRKLFEP